MELQSSLTISCSISLIMIGLILQIDLDKEDKNINRLLTIKSYPSAFISKDCQTSTENSELHSEEISRYFVSMEESYLPPSIQQLLSDNNECLSRDHTLVIKPGEVVLLDDKIRQQSLSTLLRKIDTILSANKDRKNGPVPVRLEIPVSSTNLKERNQSGSQT
ncbi:MAG TPA: hypothetical protein PJ989_09950 [Oligoflexia bacterium]|nr:hypothetical protein [Oligoflexia bacterium]